MNSKKLSQQLNEIEGELKRLGFDALKEPVSPRVTSAFGYGHMSFEQWLINVFLPNARAAIDSNSLPSESQVATAAIRNFDGDDRMENLISLLSSFDQSVREHARTKQFSALVPEKASNTFKTFLEKLFRK